MKNYDGDQINNVGCGSDVTIKELAQTIAKVAGFEGTIIFDDTKPDGVMQKLLGCSTMTALGWRSKVSLKEGIERTYQWYGNRSSNEPAALKS